MELKPKTAYLTYADAEVELVFTWTGDWEDKIQVVEGDQIIDGITLDGSSLPDQRDPVYIAIKTDNSYTNDPRGALGPTMDLFARVCEIYLEKRKPSRRDLDGWVPADQKAVGSRISAFLEMLEGLGMNPTETTEVQGGKLIAFEFKQD